MKTLALALVFLSACAALKPDRARQVTTAALNVVGSAADRLVEADDAKKSDALKKAEEGDLDGARADLQKWYVVREKLKKAIATSYDLLRAALKTIDAVEAGVSSEGLGVAVAHALAAAAELARAFADAGLPIPGVKL